MKRTLLSAAFLLFALTGTAYAAACCDGSFCCMMDMPCCD